MLELMRDINDMLYENGVELPLVYQSDGLYDVLDLQARIIFPEEGFDTPEETKSHIIKRLEGLNDILIESLKILKNEENNSNAGV